jgi:hypothetical protein
MELSCGVRRQGLAFGFTNSFPATPAQQLEDAEMTSSIARCFHWGLGMGAVLFASAMCRADDTGRAPDSTLEIIQFNAPAGWKAADPSGKPTRVYTAPDSDAARQAVIVVLLLPAQDAVDLRAVLDATVKQIAGEGKIAQSGEVTAGKSRQGYDVLWQTIVSDNPGGQHFYARVLEAKVGSRVAGIYYLATSADIYDKHQPEMDALLKSVSFNVAADAQSGVKPQPGAAAEPAAAVDQDALAKAKERFAAGVDARRKPHTILGDILGLDGKPIPDVASCDVFVWGTTIAAVTTHYGLEVDRAGHFEQQIPDGLYQIKATCVVNYAGHRVPVDLAAIDGKRVGVDQPSDRGIVKDFRMAITGLKAGEDPRDVHSYYGGLLRVNGPPFTLTTGSFSTRHPGTKVQFTLSPRGPLIDGSKLEPFMLEVDAAQLNYSARLPSIPLGDYTFTATLIGPDGARQPLQCARASEGPYGDSAEAFWQSSASNPEVRDDDAIYLKE